MADAGCLGVLVRDDLVEPVPQAVLRPFLADSRAVYPGHQIGVEQSGIGVDLIPNHAATGSLVRKERAPLTPMIGVGTTNLMIRDAQFHHAIGDGQVEVLGIPLGEVLGVRRRIVPHRPLGWRRADHAGLAAEEIGDAAEGVHPASLSHRRSSRNQADDDVEVRLHITL